MVGDHAKRDVDLFLIAIGGSASFWQRARVFFSAELFDFIKDRTKNIGLVVRNCAGEIGEIFRALNDRGRTLEPETGIDVSFRQRRETAVGIGVELNEHQIPNLDAARVVLIHERAASVAIRRKIDMQLRARAARAGIAHHPEVVGLAAVHDVNLRIEIGVLK